MILALSLTSVAFSAPKKKVQRVVRVSCIGNSITYGYGMRNPSVDSYPAKLQQMLGEGYEVGNFGRSGATLINRAYRPYMAQPEFHKALEFKGDIAVIHLGINDTDPRSWPCYQDDFVQDYSALIDSVREANPQCRVILARMTPLSDRHQRFLSGTRDWHRQIQQRIEQVARLKDCQLVDFYEPLHCHPDWFPDCIHPNREGYEALADIVYRFITGEYGGLQLAPHFSSHMVLPRNRAFALSGMANAGEKVTVRVTDERKAKERGYKPAEQTAVAALDGKWQVEVGPLEVGGPYRLEAFTKQQSIVLEDVLAGELWLASGQSNMAFRLNQAATASQDIPQSENAQIRLLNLQPRWETYNTAWSAEALDSVNHLLYYQDATWTACNPQTSPAFSAVAYYFARTLQDSLQCPIGIINNAVGGSGEEAWIDRETMEWEFPEMLRDWTNNDFLQDWVRGRAKVNMGWNGQSADKVNALQRHPYQPCYLYEASIQSLRTMPIDGVIWYQGESNAHNMETHDRLFRLLLKSWRATWHNDALPFIYTQLSSLNRPTWTWFRDLQRQELNLDAHLGMAVTSDVGDPNDVHPKEKRLVGYRLALWALHDVYGHRNVVPSGPLFTEASISKTNSREIIVRFQYGNGLATRDGKAPSTFEVAEEEGLFYPAEASIREGRLVLTCPEQVRKPRLIRYGWQPYTNANLINAQSLPASTFRGEVKE